MLEAARWPWFEFGIAAVTAHFPGRTAGRLESNGDGLRFCYTWSAPRVPQPPTAE